ncbi:MAG: phosphoribosylpyrophosphate synthetase [Candidatus Woykebacteria bacterium RBG_16_39_9b]|uniref:Ribose-phosphate pyrophosphokinase n=1 Tax=Candidatus Woykebacteria bacterium RBG_16_39_9b TaxID=1802595 RepID=A0A1G1WCG5_9BACT|nr:MAG: phosphoribosylpyrophosphate synthetase [Candidatus Woykebacteria bacterium RBG_16_39_9b]
MDRDFWIFSGRANTALANDIAKKLKIKLGKINIRDFADGEISVQLNENVRRRSVFFIQPICPPEVNKSLMELLISVDALRRASAAEITAVIPYFGYARQDRKDRPRVPITAKLVANLLEAAGISRVVCVDLHSDQIQGFFNIPVDNLYSSFALIPAIKKKFRNRLAIVSPDVGGTVRARAYAYRLKAPLVIIDKRRDPNVPNKAEAMNVIGDVKRKNVVIVDDMIDTAGTLIEAAKALKLAGADSVYAAAAHGLFSGEALSKIEKSMIEQILVTNTVPPINNSQKIKIVSIASLLAEAIKRIHLRRSVSSLFV